MRNIEREKGKKSKNKKPYSSYTWISLILTAVFFLVPLLNFIMLPFSIYFGIKAIIRTKKYPKKYGGFYLALFSVIWAIISLIMGIIVYVLIINKRIGY